MDTAGPNVDFNQLELHVLEFWRENGTFKKSLELRRDAPQYMFYDGPPFATGTPHYGHLIAGTIKDIIPRYQTMRGHYVERRFGWDTHGLPIEMLVEKDLNLNGRTDILEYGVGKFNEACRAGVLKYVDVWEQVTERLGRWIDFRNDYKTMDVGFMESVWWVFKQLWDKDLVYKGTRVMPYSWRLSTPLSNFEAGNNYKEVQDPAITVRFHLREKAGTSVLAWTTTPWTLISNLALCVGPQIDYVEVKTADGENVILAEERLATYFKGSASYEIVERYMGIDLEKFTYEPLFDYFENERQNGAFRIVCDDYVSTADGTGVVHQSPAHGEDDHRVGQANNLPLIDPVDKEGNYTDLAPDFTGQNIKAAEKGIIQALKQRGLLFRQESLTHSYPFCERSETPLIYKAISAWYVKVEPVQQRMAEHNAGIHWVPEHVKTGRFGKWLEQARDWNISRNRFWGNPIPVWVCDACESMECVGSKAELEDHCGETVDDLHSHFVDKLEWDCSRAECSGTMRRVPEVLDCWFESGSMPYAQLHYPFENKQRFEEVFPADFIAEGLDQTRGWFYTLMILSTLLFDKAPFKNCVVNGIILAEDGKKMSKRLQNYPDPTLVIKEYGADALRLYLISSPAVRAENLRFSEQGVRDIVRGVLLPFWNVYSFFTTYANVDQYRPNDRVGQSNNVLDRWIISRLQTLFAGIEREMGQYKLYAVVPALLEFLEDLTNWYVRRSRRRFWTEDVEDKQDGYNTLYLVLQQFSRALAPFLPFVTEEVYRNIASLERGLPDSVHLTDYPQENNELRDVQLESEMALIIQTVSLGRALRARLKLKTRQPLQSITVVTRNSDDADVLRKFEEHIEAELNVKEVLFSADEARLVEVNVLPNFPVCGPLFGKEMGQLKSALAGLSADQVLALEDGGSIEVLGRNLDLSHLEVRRVATDGADIETSGGVTVFFDTVLSEELVAEGRAREFVNRVQKMRKDADFYVSDRIVVELHTDSDLLKALEKHSEYIKQETLAVQLNALDSAPSGGELVQTHAIDDFTVSVGLYRANGVD